MLFFLLYTWDVSSEVTFYAIHHVYTLPDWRFGRSGASWVLRKSEFSTNTVKFIVLHKVVWLKSRLQHTGTSKTIHSMNTPSPVLSVSSTFFASFDSLRFYSRTEISGLLKQFISLLFLNILNGAYVWRCVTLLSIIRGMPTCRKLNEITNESLLSFPSFRLKELWDKNLKLNKANDRLLSCLNMAVKFVIMLRRLR